MELKLYAWEKKKYKERHKSRGERRVKKKEKVRLNNRRNLNQMSCNSFEIYKTIILKCHTYIRHVLRMVSECSVVKVQSYNITQRNWNLNSVLKRELNSHYSTDSRTIWTTKGTSAKALNNYTFETHVTRVYTPIVSHTLGPYMLHFNL